MKRTVTASARARGLLLGAILCALPGCTRSNPNFASGVADGGAPKDGPTPADADQRPDGPVAGDGATRPLDGGAADRTVRRDGSVATDGGQPQDGSPPVDAPRPDTTHDATPPDTTRDLLPPWPDIGLPDFFPPVPDGGPLCGNGVCEIGESCDGRLGTAWCPDDCPGQTSGPKTERFCFINGFCVGAACP